MSFLGGGLEKSGRAFGQEINRANNNRRALNAINQNSVVNQAYPCVVNKRVLSGYLKIFQFLQILLF